MLDMGVNVLVTRIIIFHSVESLKIELPPKPVPSHSIIPIFAITSMTHPVTHASSLDIICSSNVQSSLLTFNQSQNHMCLTFLSSILPLHSHLCVTADVASPVLFRENTAIVF